MVSIVAVIFGTNVFHYAVFDSSFSHIYSFFLFAWFYYVYFKIFFDDNKKLQNFVIIGIISGLIAITRPTNVFFPLIFLGYYFGNLLWRRKETIGNLFIRLIVVILAAIPPIIPQLVYWYVNTGDFVSYSYGDEGFDFANPHILEVLFGTRRGMILWSPVAFLALLITIFAIWKSFSKKNKGERTLEEKKINTILSLTLVFFIINIYVTSSWWMWWYGGSFGYRAITESFVLLALPISLGLKSKYRKKLLVLLAILISVVTILMLLYWAGHIDYDRGQLNL